MLGRHMPNVTLVGNAIPPIPWSNILTIGLTPYSNRERGILKAPPANPRTYLFFLLLDKPRSYITIDLIFYAPNVENLSF